jgi:hypothetical protein
MLTSINEVDPWWILFRVSFGMIPMIIRGLTTTSESSVWKRTIAATFFSRGNGKKNDRECPVRRKFVAYSCRGDPATLG